MIHLTDEKMAYAASAGALHLGMAFEAEIGIPLDEQLGIDGAMGVVADGAAFAQSFVLKNERAALFAMALRTGLVEAGHGEATGGFHDVGAMGIVALDTIHFAFDDRMMLGQMKLGLNFLMAGETGFRVLAGINDEFATATAGGDVFAAGTVAGFAPLLAGHLRMVQMQPGMRTGRKHVTDGSVAIRTDFIADKSGALNLRRGHHRTRSGGAGAYQSAKRPGDRQHSQSDPPATFFHNTHRS
ncbi:MAG: hypothetical protein JWR19_384 [Pedosphaera sp.]|nr:hypothetical protein [Pedosphaera sp.]